MRPRTNPLGPSSASGARVSLWRFRAPVVYTGAERAEG